MSYDTNSTNLLTLNNEPFPSQQQQTSSSTPDAKQISKLILRSALQKANAAVQCDSTNDVMGAIEAYREAISLLEHVLATVDKENDRRRLQEIHDSYSERIRLLSTITSKLESEVLLKPSGQYKSNDEGDDEDDDDEEEEHVQHWKTSRLNTNHNFGLKKMNSSSSIDSSIIVGGSTPRRQWQENNNSFTMNRFISQKEKSTKIPVSPPNAILQLKASKSTPTKSHSATAKSKYDEFDLEKDELNLLGQHESPVTATIIKRPPRNSSRVIINKKSTINNRSSISSIESSTSSIESSENSSILEQPPMALPSLKNNDDNNTPLPSKKSNFRARTSSLPKSPLMQRSSSMSNTTLSLDEEEEEERIIENSQQQQQQQPPAPPPLIINRPIVSRPSVGGSLGSMRKKAANRLSMDGLVNRKASSNTTSNPGPPIYGLFLKDQIQSPTTNDMDYMVDNKDQRHSIEQQFENYSIEETISEPNNSYLKLILALEKSMLEGAHITQKLYIPKNLWQQPNIRLSCMDIKISACESILIDISRLENWSYLDDLSSSTRLLENFESSIDQIQSSLSKKLKRDSHVENSNGNSNNASSPSSVSGASIMSSGSSIMSTSTRDSMSTIGRTDSGKKTQSFMSWGTKFTKSVERMNAFSLTKTNSEDQYRNYIEVLQKLFAKMHILENWLSHYSMEKRKSRQSQHDVLIMKLVKICTVINNVVGGFVVRDITVLLAKWLKRGGTWVNE